MLARLILRLDDFTLFYNVPIVGVFVLYIFDVLARERRWSRAQLVLAAGVILAALIRARALIPGYSGHALFLAFALFTAQERLTRLLILLVLMQTTLVKVWANDWTLATGAVLGMIAALIHRKLAHAQPQSPLSHQNPHH